MKKSSKPTLWELLAFFVALASLVVSILVFYFASIRITEDVRAQLIRLDVGPGTKFAITPSLRAELLLSNYGNQNAIVESIYLILVEKPEPNANFLATAHWTRQDPLILHPQETTVERLLNEEDYPVFLREVPKNTWTYAKIELRIHGRRRSYDPEFYVGEIAFWQSETEVYYNAPIPYGVRVLPPETLPPYLPDTRPPHQGSQHPAAK